MENFGQEDLDGTFGNIVKMVTGDNKCKFRGIVELMKVLDKWKKDDLSKAEALCIRILRLLKLSTLNEMLVDVPLSRDEILRMMESMTTMKRSCQALLPLLPTIIIIVNNFIRNHTATLYLMDRFKSGGLNEEIEEIANESTNEERELCKLSLSETDGDNSNNPEKNKMDNEETIDKDFDSSALVRSQTYIYVHQILCGFKIISNFQAMFAENQSESAEHQGEGERLEKENRDIESVSEHSDDSLEEGEDDYDFVLSEELDDLNLEYCRFMEDEKNNESDQVKTSSAFDEDNLFVESGSLREKVAFWKVWVLLYKASQKEQFKTNIKVMSSLYLCLESSVKKEFEYLNIPYTILNVYLCGIVGRPLEWMKSNRVHFKSLDLNGETEEDQKLTSKLSTCSLGCLSRCLLQAKNNLQPWFKLYANKIRQVVGTITLMRGDCPFWAYRSAFLASSFDRDAVWLPKPQDDEGKMLQLISNFSKLDIELAMERYACEEFTPPENQIEDEKLGILYGIEFFTRLVEFLTHQPSYLEEINSLLACDILENCRGLIQKLSEHYINGFPDSIVKESLTVKQIGQTMHLFIRWIEFVPDDVGIVGTIETTLNNCLKFEFEGENIITQTLPVVWYYGMDLLHGKISALSRIFCLSKDLDTNIDSMLRLTVALVSISRYILAEDFCEVFKLGTSHTEDVEKDSPLDETSNYILSLEKVENTVRIPPLVRCDETGHKRIALCISEPAWNVTLSDMSLDSICLMIFILTRIPYTQWSYYVVDMDSFLKTICEITLCVVNGVIFHESIIPYGTMMFTISNSLILGISYNNEIQIKLKELMRQPTFITTDKKSTKD